MSQALRKNKGDYMDSIVHFEIPADNMDRASQFYKKTFGWEMQPVPGQDYTLVMTTETDPQTGPKEKGAINGGLAKRQDYFPAPSLSVNVKDIDKALKEVKANGGEVVQGKKNAGGFGFTAIFKDSEGNYMGLWQSDWKK